MQDFFYYLKTNKLKSENTLIAYKRDLGNFEKFMREYRNKNLAACNESDAIAYVLNLNSQNKSKATVNRSISALRTFYDYKILMGQRIENPFLKIKTYKSESRKVDFLTVAEVESLLALPDESSKGLRDKALLEFLYGTGARVTEVVRLKISDLNLRMGFVTLKDVNEESRIVPLGTYAKEAIMMYLAEGFSSLKGETADEDDYVFINYRGDALSRQGIWKILKEYGAKIGIENRMTPQILRDSFAVHILQNGGDLKTLQELMGFDDMSVGITYLAVTDIHVREVFAKCHPRA